MTARRAATVVIASTLVVVAGFTLLWRAATTSTARLSASTSGSGSFVAGTVELDQPETVVALLFDADGLYPGRIVSSCVTLAYEGSLPADVRLHAARSGGTGLEDHVELRLAARRDTAGSGACPVDGEPDRPVGPVGDPVYSGLLGDLWRGHPDYASGLVLAEGSRRGDRLILDAEVEMVGGDEAQGLTTEFAIVVEARP